MNKIQPQHQVGLLESSFMLIPKRVHPFSPLSAAVWDAGLCMSLYGVHRSIYWGFDWNPSPVLDYKGTQTLPPNFCVSTFKWCLFIQNKKCCFVISVVTLRKWPLVRSLGTGHMPANISPTSSNRTMCMWKYAQKVLFSVTGYVISAVNNPKKNIDVYSI